MNSGSPELFDLAPPPAHVHSDENSEPDRRIGPADDVALARLYGEPLFRLPDDLYIPPDALEIFLEAFEGPLDFLLYLIRKQHFNVLDIPMAPLTLQYLTYIDQIRENNLELAAEYLLMAALLIEIKSRMLLPTRKTDSNEVEDPRAELVRKLLEYERIKLAARRLDELPKGWTGLLDRGSGDRAVTRTALSRCRRGRPARCLARCRAARETHGEASCQPRGVVGSRAHEPDPEDAAGNEVHRVR